MVRERATYCQSDPEIVQMFGDERLDGNSASVHKRDAALRLLECHCLVMQGRVLVGC